MQRLTLNNADSYEPIQVRLSKKTTPIAFEQKVQELIEECGMTREQAEQTVTDTVFELELYYQQGSGLFAVESEAVEAGIIYSPYSGERCSEPQEDRDPLKEHRKTLMQSIDIRARKLYHAIHGKLPWEGEIDDESSFSLPVPEGSPLEQFRFRMPLECPLIEEPVYVNSLIKEIVFDVDNIWLRTTDAPTRREEGETELDELSTDELRALSRLLKDTLTQKESQKNG